MIQLLMVFDILVVEAGDFIEDCSKENTLILVNHQSTGDVPLCMQVFASRSQFNGRVMWIMLKIFKCTNFGLVSSFHGDFFIGSVSLTYTYAIIFDW